MSGYDLNLGLVILKLRVGRSLETLLGALLFNLLQKPGALSYGRATAPSCAGTITLDHEDENYEKQAQPAYQVTLKGKDVDR